jgi:hypothetical protein
VVRGECSFSKAVDRDVHGIASVGACPGEAQGVRVSADEVEHGLEQQEVGGGGRGNREGVREKGKAKPAILLHGKQAAVDKSQDIAGVSVDVQGGTGPGLEGEEDSAEFC